MQGLMTYDIFDPSLGLRLIISYNIISDKWYRISLIKDAHLEAAYWAFTGAAVIRGGYQWHEKYYSEMIWIGRHWQWHRTGRSGRRKWLCSYFLLSIVAAASEKWERAKVWWGIGWLEIWGIILRFLTNLSYVYNDKHSFLAKFNIKSVHLTLGLSSKS